MKAKITKRVSNAINMAGKREVVGAYSVVACRKGQPVEAVVARAYMGRSRNASTVYASIWCHPADNSEWTSGSGSAGGYGYHKESAAFQEAIDSAGIELYGDVYAGLNREPEDMKKRAYIHGVGDSAMREAFFAIARALGYRGKLELIRH
jgi:hypothetical protein